MNIRMIALFLLAGCTVESSHAPEGLYADGAAEHIARIEAEVVAARIVDEEPGPRLSARMEQLGVPALSIAVFENGAISWAKAYGMADSSEGRSATTTTLFQAASISKPVAATAMHAMVEDGLLDLDADINTFLTSWQLPDNGFTTVEKVTLRRITNHTAGTTVHGFPGYARDEPLPSTVDVLDGRGNTDSVRVYKVPGESWQYSGGGYTIMQLAMADVSGRPFPDIVRDRVLVPAGMDDSGYMQPLPEDRWNDAATGYRRDGSEVDGKWHVYPEMAAAGLWTTPSDLARFAIALQRDLHGAGILLDSTTVREMMTPGFGNHGLGPGISDDGLRFGHGGANEGFRCQLTAFLDGRGGVAVMTNSDAGGVLAQEILLTVARAYGWPGMEPEHIQTAQLTDAEYERVTGTYAFDFGDLIITYADGSLVARDPDGNTLTLVPTSSTEFVGREGPNRVSLELEGEEVRALVIDGRLRGERK